MGIVRAEKTLLLVTKDCIGNIKISFAENLTDDDIKDFDGIMTDICKYLTQEDVRRHGL